MMNEVTASGSGPVPFGDRLISSSAFKELFREGMSLVEETAAYLDGPGRDESRLLERAGTLAFATESMRLTTRLMQLASWLLLQRAVNEGEMTPEQARAEKSKVRLGASAPVADAEVLDMLPARLAELVDASVRLHGRIRHLDEVLSTPVEPGQAVQDNAVGQQLARLRQVFGAGA